MTTRGIICPVCHAFNCPCAAAAQERMEAKIMAAMGVLRSLIDEDAADRAEPTWHDDATEAIAFVSSIVNPKAAIDD